MFIARLGDVNNHKQMVDTRASASNESQREALEHRFKAFLDLAGFTRPEFAALEGMTQQHITTWLSRGRFGRAAVQHMRNIALMRGIEGFSEDWINLGTGKPPRHGRTGEEAKVDASPVIESTDHPATPTQNGDYVTFEFLQGYSKGRIRFVDIPVCLLNNVDALLKPSIRVFINPTDSLRGVIDKGDLAFVDTDVRRFDGDGIYVYKLATIPQIKRFQIQGQGSLRLHGTHSYEDSIELSAAQIQGLEIGGRVVGSIGFSQF